jgi:hypothetical protein
LEKKIVDKLAEWQKVYLEQLKNAPNHILLGMYVEEQIPDDYDGGFTEMGSWKHRVSAEEFFIRLVISGWITEEQLEESKVLEW